MIQESPLASRQKVRDDLVKLRDVPAQVLQNVFKKVVESFPCNIYDLAKIETRSMGIDEPWDLSDAIAAAVYVWDNTEAESVSDVIADLEDLQLLDASTSPILTQLLNIAVPLREVSKTSAAYSTIGAALFTYIVGAVDIRCRFHEKVTEYQIGKQPTKLLGATQMIMVNLGYRNPDGEDMVLGMQMDTNDLHTLKRFVDNMVTELELTRSMMPKEG
jgi:hypothetical protein